MCVAGSTYQTQNLNDNLSRSTNTCDCGNSKHGIDVCNGASERIVNGEFAQPGEFPWQVALTSCLYIGYSRKCFACGGTIINNKYVITAMHCLETPPGFGKGYGGRHIPASGITVTVGEHNKKSLYGLIFTKKVGVSRVIRRVDYNPSRMYNDIAILELDERLKFNKDVKPACLPTNKENTYANSYGVVTGWGAIQFQGPSSGVLKKIGLKILSNSNMQCIRGAMNGWSAPGNEKMCAYARNGDSCQGDSGGPMVTVEDGRCTLVGVVSYGHKCAIPGYAGVYARITHYLDWIIKNTKDGGCGFSLMNLIQNIPTGST